MDVTDWDSNYSGSTLLLKKTQIEISCHTHQRGEGNLSAFSVHLSFDKLFPILYQLFGRVYRECVPLSESATILNIISFKIMLDRLLVI